MEEGEIFERGKWYNATYAYYQGLGSPRYSAKLSLSPSGKIMYVVGKWRDPYSIEVNSISGDKNRIVVEGKPSWSKERIESFIFYNIELE